jgi:hypothetical protein
MNSDIMGVLREQSRVLLHLRDADSISFADNSMMSAIIASTPYSGRPTGVVIDMIPDAADDVVLAVVAVTVVISMISPIYLIYSM